MKTPQFQMETYWKLLMSNMCNLDHWGGQTEFQYHQSRYDCEEDQISFALVIQIGDPRCYKEKIVVDDRDKWDTSME